MISFLNNVEHITCFFFRAINCGKTFPLTWIKRLYEKRFCSIINATELLHFWVGETVNCENLLCALMNCEYWMNNMKILFQPPFFPPRYQLDYHHYPPHVIVKDNELCSSQHHSRIPLMSSVVKRLFLCSCTVTSSDWSVWQIPQAWPAQWKRLCEEMKLEQS